MIAILCPGQGSQAPGMLTPWLEVDGVDTEGALARHGAATGVDLRALGTVADAETITDTSVAQPLIVSASLLSLAALEARAGDRSAWASVAAGHSVGELAAVVAAGVLSEDDALHLVAVRGRAMADAASATPTGMSAVVGGDPEEVAAALARHDLVAANVNGGGQQVAAGARSDLDALREDAPAKARVIPLAVAGAFHTRYMEPAVDAVRETAAGLSPAEPRLRLLTNHDGSVVPSGTAALEGLVAQVARPVRWDLCQQTLADLGVTAAVELAPGKVLAGLARRTLPGVEVVTLTSPDQLDAAADLIARHRTQETR